MSSPTQRSLAMLRKDGWAVVCYNRYRYAIEEVEQQFCEVSETKESA